MWTYLIARGRIGLLAWTITAAAFAWLFMSLAPTFMDAWTSFTFVGALTGGAMEQGAQVLYNTFAAELVAPIIAAFVVTQAASWAADHEQSRVEMFVATGVSTTRLIVERLVSLTIGMVVIITAWLAAIGINGALVDNGVELSALLRTGICALLFGLALAGLAVLVVAITRSGIVVIVLAIYVAAAYLLILIVPMLGWPQWLEYTSVFWAFEHPYLQWPSAGGIAVMCTFALLGTASGALVSDRLPKVA